MISSPGCGPDVEMGPKFQYHSRIQTTAHPLISILIPLHKVWQGGRATAVPGSCSVSRVLPRTHVLMHRTQRVSFHGGVMNFAQRNNMLVVSIQAVLRNISTARSQNTLATARRVRPSRHVTHPRTLRLVAASLFQRSDIFTTLVGRFEGRMGSCASSASTGGSLDKTPCCRSVQAASRVLTKVVGRQMTYSPLHPFAPLAHFSTSTHHRLLDH